VDVGVGNRGSIPLASKLFVINNLQKVDEWMITDAITCPSFSANTDRPLGKGMALRFGPAM
jgi:hypothetical protein